jgi:hypothetical protein
MRLRSVNEIIRDLMNDTGPRAPRPAPQAPRTVEPAAELMSDDVRQAAQVAFEHCRRTVMKWWPAYWWYIEAILSAAATLTGVVTVTTTDAKKVSTRGMTTKFTTFEEAVSSVKKVEDEAVKKGWKRSVRAGGFVAKPDAFSSIPSAPKSGAK